GDGSGRDRKDDLPFMDRLLEDVRQLAAHLVGAGHACRATGRMDTAPFGGLRLDRLCLAKIALPTILPVIATLAPRHSGITMRSHFAALASDVLHSLLQTGLLVAFLA